MDRFTPFSVKRRPDQTSHDLNALARKQSNEDYSKWVYNQDKTKAIVIVVQPNGDFGLRQYKISGDNIEEELRLW